MAQQHLKVAISLWDIWEGRRIACKGINDQNYISVLFISLSIWCRPWQSSTTREHCSYSHLSHIIIRFNLGIFSVNHFLIKSTGSWKTSTQVIGTGCGSAFLSLWVASLFFGAKSQIQFFHTFMQYYVKPCQRNLSYFVSQDSWTLPATSLMLSRLMHAQANGADFTEFLSWSSNFLWQLYSLSPRKYDVCFQFSMTVPSQTSWVYRWNTVHSPIHCYLRIQAVEQRIAIFLPLIFC